MGKKGGKEIDWDEPTTEELLRVVWDCTDENLRKAAIRVFKNNNPLGDKCFDDVFSALARCEQKLKKSTEQYLQNTYKMAKEGADPNWKITDIINQEWTLKEVCLALVIFDTMKSVGPKNHIKFFKVPDQLSFELTAKNAAAKYKRFTDKFGIWTGLWIKESAGIKESGGAVKKSKNKLNLAAKKKNEETMKEIEETFKEKFVEELNLAYKKVIEDEEDAELKDFDSGGEMKDLIDNFSRYADKRMSPSPPVPSLGGNPPVGSHDKSLDGRATLQSPGGLSDISVGSPSLLCLTPLRELGSSSKIVALQMGMSNEIKRLFLCTKTYFGDVMLWYSELASRKEELGLEDELLEMIQEEIRTQYMAMIRSIHGFEKAHNKMSQEFFEALFPPKTVLTKTRDYNESDSETNRNIGLPRRFLLGDELVNPYDEAVTKFEEKYNWNNVETAAYISSLNSGEQSSTASAVGGKLQGTNLNEILSSSVGGGIGQSTASQSTSIGSKGIHDASQAGMGVFPGKSSNESTDVSAKNAVTGIADGVASLSISSSGNQGGDGDLKVHGQSNLRWKTPNPVPKGPGTGLVSQQVPPDTSSDVAGVTSGVSQRHIGSDGPVLGSPITVADECKTVAGLKVLGVDGGSQQATASLSGSRQATASHGPHEKTSHTSTVGGGDGVTRVRPGETWCAGEDGSVGAAAKPHSASWPANKSSDSPVTDNKNIDRDVEHSGYTSIVSGDTKSRGEDDQSDYHDGKIDDPSAVRGNGQGSHDRSEVNREPSLSSLVEPHSSSSDSHDFEQEESFNRLFPKKKSAKKACKKKE